MKQGTNNRALVKFRLVVHRLKSHLTQLYWCGGINTSKYESATDKIQWCFDQLLVGLSIMSMWLGKNSLLWADSISEDLLLSRSLTSFQLGYHFIGHTVLRMRIGQVDSNVSASHLDPPTNGNNDSTAGGLYFWIINFGNNIGKLNQAILLFLSRSPHDIMLSLLPSSLLVLERPLQKLKIPWKYPHQR